MGCLGDFARATCAVILCFTCLPCFIPCVYVGKGGSKTKVNVNVENTNTMASHQGMVQMQPMPVQPGVQYVQQPTAPLPQNGVPQEFAYGMPVDEPEGVKKNV